MKSTIFSKSLKVLIITLLILTVLFNRNLSQRLMLAAILIWISLAVCLLFGPRIIALLSLIRARYLQWKQETAAEKRSCTDADGVPVPPEIVPETETPVPSVPVTSAAPSGPTAESILSEQQKQEQKRMLQHISLRITEKIKSAYPDATWQWEDTPCLSAILEGHPFRIAAADMERYTHADVCFDQFARIHITPIIIGEFAAAVSADTQPDTEDAKEPPVVDVQSWYELIGKNALEAIITDLNTKGHSRLSIKENGDIVITRNKKESLKGTLEQFPPKNYWKEFLNLLEEYELHGKVDKDQIIISWN